YQLGMPIQNYQTSPTVARQRIINGSVALFLAAICLALIPVHITFILPALLLLFYTVRMFLQYRQNQAVSVLLAPDGVLRIKHQEVEAITWDDISEIWLTPSLGYKTLYQYRIHDATKQRLTF